MSIHLKFPYLASTKCLWHKTMEIVMGGRNRSPVSVSFPIDLNKPWRCILAQKYTGYVHGYLETLLSLGGAPLYNRTSSSDWPKYIVLSSGGTFSQRKWVLHHEQASAKLNGLLLNLHWDSDHVCCVLLWPYFSEWKIFKVRVFFVTVF